MDVREKGGTRRVALTEAMEERLLQETKSLVIFLQVALRNGKIYGLSNEAFLQPMARFQGILYSLLPLEGAISLREAEGYLFVNERRLRFDLEGFLSYTRLVEELRRRKIGEVTFQEEVSGEELHQFVSLLTLDERAERPWELMQKGLLQRGVTHVSVEAPVSIRFSSAKEGGKGRELARYVFLKGIGQVRKVLNQTAAAERIDIKGSKRVVQSLVDLILGEDLFILGLTSIKNYDDYTANHSVNVSILSLALGSRLGYSKLDLYRLGMAAFFHDIGKVRIPEELINKPAALNQEEFKVVSLHPYYGVLPLMRLKGFSDIVLRAMIASFEHHLNYDLSGYPPLSQRRRLTLFSRIIRIADSFDAMTTARVYRPIPLLPDQALAIMMDEAGRAYDPVLLKLFVNTIGIYPRGTLVRFDTGEVGIVVNVSPLPEYIHLPQVELVRDSKGNPIEGEVVDLAREGERRRIVRSVFPRELGINIVEYLWRR